MFEYFKSEATVLSWKRVDCPILVREELLPQEGEFKYFRVLFKDEGKMKWKVDRRIRMAASACQFVVVKREKLSFNC